MKRVVTPHWYGLIAALSLMTSPALADLEVTASVQIHSKAEFEAPLAAHGTWVEVGSYGRCWRPGQVGVEWRPYGAGEWVWTDCGWYWSSDEPWAWACYHYGWWVYDPAWGWVWVPQVEWAPAWVSWRVGGGYIGWAPLPPPGLIFARHPEPSLFVFVGTAQFGGRVRPGALIVKNNSIFSHTTELSGPTREARTLGGSGSQKVMVNHGPDIQSIQKDSGRTFKAIPIQEAARRSSASPQAKHADSAVRGDQAQGGHEDHPDHGANHTDAPHRDSFGPSLGDGGRGGRWGGGGHGKH